MKRSLLVTLTAEFLGTLFFVFLSGATVQITAGVSQSALNCTRIVTIAFTEGFLFYSLVFLTMKLSGGDCGFFNPAVTLSIFIFDVFSAERTMLCKRMNRMLFLSVSQFCGGMLGAAMLLLTVPSHASSGLLATSLLSLHESVSEAFLMEMMLSFFLLLIILSVRLNETRRSSLILAFGIISITLASFPLTGGSMNPAKSFGPALISSNWANIWVYLIAPLVGSVLSTIVFLAIRGADIKEYQNQNYI